MASSARIVAMTEIRGYTRDVAKPIQPTPQLDATEWSVLMKELEANRPTPEEREQRLAKARAYLARTAEAAKPMAEHMAQILASKSTK